MRCVYVARCRVTETDTATGAQEQVLSVRYASASASMVMQEQALTPQWLDGRRSPPVLGARAAARTWGRAPGWCNPPLSGGRVLHADDELQVNLHPSQCTRHTEALLASTSGLEIASNYSK